MAHRAGWAGWIAAALALPHLAGPPPGDGSAAGFATLSEKDVAVHAGVLAAPALMGRDSPSLGLERAARYIAARFAEAGLESADGDDFTIPFELDVPVPTAPDCSLEILLDGSEPRAFALGRDFVPVAGCEGAARGELVFLGFGIDAGTEHFDEIPARGLAGKVALILEGEPNHERRFDGEETTRYAALWSKLHDLREAGASGVIVVRRAAAGEDRLSDEVTGGDGAPDLGFRHQWATWVGAETTPRPHDGREALPPTLEVDAACAAELLGTDVEALAQRSDKSGKPPRFKPGSKGTRTVSLRSTTERGKVSVDNVVGLVRGSDPDLAQEYVVLGAHYDHVGVDERGRIGCGADDNASGTAALLELAQAFATAPARRSVVLCAFAAEEKGLLGSKAFCERPPVPLEKIVAMLNMDMLGRGDVDEVAVLGVERTPQFEALIQRAGKLARTGVKKIVMHQGEDLWERSDHFSFHEQGVPALFFFEGLPISRNADYHTWRDTVDKLDADKIARSTRLVFNTAWLLANDDEKPPRPRD